MQGLACCLVAHKISGTMKSPILAILRMPRAKDVLRYGHLETRSEDLFFRHPRQPHTFRDRDRTRNLGVRFALGWDLMNI